jgi:acetyl esterase/lipase
VRGRAVALLGASLVAAATTGCGAGGSSPPPLVERSVGTGPHQLWVFQEKGREPKSLVVFLHGLGGPSEDTPVNHLDWLRHLARQGSMVVFPRYERYPGDTLAPQYLLETLGSLAQSTNAAEKPILVLGYSRGGGLGVTYSTIAAAAGLEPRIVVGLFPAINDRQLDPAGAAPGTRYVFLVGDRDEVVGARGATTLRRWLLANGYPSKLISIETIRSSPDFTASHLSALESTPAAQKALWVPVDRLVDEARAGS